MTFFSLLVYNWVGRYERNVQFIYNYVKDKKRKTFNWTDKQPELVIYDKFEIAVC